MDSTREILHQVKNHLAVYSSLLRLMRASLEDPGERVLLDKMEALFSVFAQVYQRLHHEQTPSEEGDPGSLKAGPYLRDLAEAFRLPPWDIPLVSEIELSDRQILSRDAVPLGLLLTEVLLSLGGSEKLSVKIQLSISRDSEYWRLLLEGRKPGFSEETELMVSALAAQLNGRVEAPIPGTEAWSVLFPLSLFSH